MCCFSKKKRLVRMQGEWPEKKPTLLTLWTQTCRTQNYEKINCPLSPSNFDSLSWENNTACKSKTWWLQIPTDLLSRAVHELVNIIIKNFVDLINSFNEHDFFWRSTLVNPG
jgi:hypothetical protein